MSRVVITGVGPVTPIGIGRDTFWQAALAGRSGVGSIQAFDASGFPGSIAADVRDFRPDRFLTPKVVRSMDRFAQMALAGAQLALNDAGLDPSQLEPYRSGVILGSAFGGIVYLEGQFRNLFERGPHRVSPSSVPQLTANAAASQVAIRYGFKGPNLTVATACSSANTAIGLAFDAIFTGRADMMVTGGTEAAVTAGTMAAFANCACSRLEMTTRLEPADPSIGSGTVSYWGREQAFCSWSHWAMPESGEPAFTARCLGTQSVLKRTTW